MRRRRLYFRGLGLFFLVLGLAVAALGVWAGGGLFPRNVNPFLSRKASTASNGETNAYYAAILAPNTLAEWKTAYFPSTGGTKRASANYYNAGDLGFGREMHCYEEDDFTACYVANHGLGAGAPAEIAVQDAVSNQRILPTVAMVYNYTIDGLINDVTFYAYDAAGNRLNSVALDSEGEKFIPQICLACHGGTYSNITHGVTQANFLPWDIDSFVYSPTPGQTKADQLEQFRLLNAMVRYSAPDDKISALIDGWYGGVEAVYNPSAVYDDSYIPPAYNGNAADQALYTEVVRHYCRGCHMAQAFDLEDPTQLDSAFYAVFVDRDMPHAQLTSHRFWTSPAPAILARRFDNGNGTYRVTTTADSTPDGCTSAATTNGCTLREAVIAANSNADPSVIVFDAEDFFQLTRTGAVEDAAATGDLDITQDLTILGNGINATQISGQNSDRVFEVRNGASVLIQNVLITSGAAGIGAGIRVTGSGSDLILNNAVLQFGTATDGGGLAVDGGGAAEVHQSAIFFNTASGSGGGVFVDNLSTVTLYDTTISDNSADIGGGVYSGFGSTASLDHTTVVRNLADTLGRGVMAFDGASVFLGRSIVVGNTGDAASECAVDVGGAVGSNGYNLVGQNNNAGLCPTNGTGDLVLAGTYANVLGSYLAFAPNGQAFYPPVAGSPVLDAIPLAGGYCTTPSYDQRNLSRPRDANNNGVLGCDIGAVEQLTFPIYLPLARR